jgi:hypothetical protein
VENPFPLLFWDTFMGWRPLKWAATKVTVGLETEYSFRGIYAWQTIQEFSP